MTFRTPLGVVLAGGGAHGSWQAGCLDALSAAGVSFDKVLGISAGALNGVAYVLDRMPQLLGFWYNVDQLRVMRWDVRWRPFSLFSNQPMWEALQYVHDEHAAKRALRREFTAVSLCMDDGKYHYARFTPQASGAWDGPLAAKIVASCSVPRLFPPVRLRQEGQERSLVDGGFKGKDWISFAEMASCKDVVVLQMLRPEDIGRRRPIAQLMGDQLGRDLLHGVESLLRLPNGPRVYRVVPQRRLGFTPYAFSSQYCRPGLELGRADGRRFLQNPSDYLLDPQ